MKAFGFLLVAICLQAGSTARASTYFVGNSLTLDGLGHYTAEGLGFEQLAKNAGVDLDYGFHIRCNSTLRDTLANSTETCIASPFQYGKFFNALPNYEWDAVTLQPYVGSSLRNDAAACKAFIALTQAYLGNDDTAFYIYSAWPARTAGKFSEYWTTELKDDDNTPSQQRRSYFDHLFERVKGDNDATLRLIPVGEVFYQLDCLIDAGKLPGVTSFSEFYRDDFHLSKLGMYVASATILATTEREDPSQFVVPASNYGDISPETLQALHKAIWDVVVSELRTGVADFDDDGAVGASDLQLWKARNPQADANGDEIIDGADFLLWQRQSSAVIPHLASVPEPTAATLGSLALMFLACNHLRGDRDPRACRK